MGAALKNGLAYYNEHDAKAAAWLRELIKAGCIAPGWVDVRCISRVQFHEIEDHTQHHFFAGIGGWSLALRLAGWPDECPVWTGSCPCQPFSQAGKGLGTADARHLWPQFARLIADGAPANVFGEQVASKAGRGWLAGMRADLEAMGYGVGSADLCAAGVGAPHIRQRLYWVAKSERAGGKPGRLADQSREGIGTTQAGASIESRRHGLPGGVVFANGAGRDARREAGEGLGYGGSTESASGAGGVGNANAVGRTGEPFRFVGAIGKGNWADCKWLRCLDGKARRVESGTFPLAHGVPGRVGLLRGYGNAIVPQVAAEFIGAYLDVVTNG